MEVNTRKKKVLKVLGIIGLVILGFFFLRLILMYFVVGGVLAIDLLAPTKSKNGTENYDKAFFEEQYGGDLGSTLMIFPDSLEGKGETSFSSSLKTGFFDTDGYILLECTMEEAEFQKEIQRLSSLKATITDGKTSVTNDVLYDETSYRYPAYVTCDGFDSTYEYALIDEESHRIIYLYISYPNVTNLHYAKYLKKNPLAYTKDGLDSYSMYYHTFDGGQSYIGYQEDVAAAD